MITVMKAEAIHRHARLCLGGSMEGVWQLHYPDIEASYRLVSL